MIARIIWGLVIVVAGAIITIKSEWFHRNFGSIPAAEKYLGTEGGSRLAYKLIGITATIIGFMIMTNLLGPAIISIFGKFFGGIAG